ncbi:ElyC/SanA/YdcF family protein [Furfurilactobacillus milii]|uniref:YdcF family protein n=1 Tax=Furfurilactobacillus milii TaxID=2888272 RepID=A0ABT6D7X0_9LACO|nr:ElyC/SanA/YdcF family protein [Furfurilactobacillus milii]QLE65815.1 hypothetical protein LROSL2_0462 [Furfurilactobacillus rossiae]MCF6160276.1 YdcF family protein [Furfurilactobacillus milii]MCF6162219.1 YdcF family protein [Furfurilactobacillus milii]MCF6420438.1 YdcF family protein [Furfurilactobacillus milii]MDF9913238.1 YdcF family protein [Furfurilactobacillus milii]
MIDLTTLSKKRLDTVANRLNQLSLFLGQRDVDTLTTSALQQQFRIQRIDALALFGGSILEGANVMHAAISHHVAKHYVLVGGAGHTTPLLRTQMAQHGIVAPEDATESALFQRYLLEKFDDHVDLLETKSTNSGNNVTNTLALLKNQQLKINTLGIMQDATMQRRLAAGFKKFAPQITLINYATYAPHIVVKDNQLTFATTALGMWTMTDFITLLLGEVARLHDDANGYGPNGQSFIAHVHVPSAIVKADAFLHEMLQVPIRSANTAFKSSVK